MLTDSKTVLRRRLLGVGCYAALYLLAFVLLEHRAVSVHLIHTPIDERIPFCALFVVPYLLWFFYVAGTVLCFALKEEDEGFRALCRSLCLGCTLFLLISLALPNGHALRPALTGETIWERLVLLVYAADTPTNVFPSIHVFNALVCCEAIRKSDALGKGRGVVPAAEVLTALIVLSTLFLKQHTLADVVGAMALHQICSRLFYPDGEQRQYLPAVVHR